MASYCWTKEQVPSVAPIIYYRAAINGSFSSQKVSKPSLLDSLRPTDLTLRKAGLLTTSPPIISSSTKRNKIETGQEFNPRHEEKKNEAEKNTSIVMTYSGVSTVENGRLPAIDNQIEVPQILGGSRSGVTNLSDVSLQNEQKTKETNLIPFHEIDISLQPMSLPPPPPIPTIAPPMITNIHIMISEDLSCIQKGSVTDRFDIAGVIQISSLIQDDHELKEKKIKCILSVSDTSNLITSMKANISLATGAITGGAGVPFQCPLKIPLQFDPPVAVLKYSVSSLHSAPVQIIKARGLASLKDGIVRVVIQILINSSLLQSPPAAAGGEGDVGVVPPLEGLQIMASLASLISSTADMGGINILSRPPGAINTTSKVMMWAVSGDALREHSLTMDCSFDKAYASDFLTSNINHNEHTGPLSVPVMVRGQSSTSLFTNCVCDIPQLERDSNKHLLLEPKVKLSKKSKFEYRFQ